LETPFYIIPVAAITAKSFIEHTTIQHIKQLSGDDAVIKLGVDAWEKPESFINNAHVLMLMGGTVCMDFFTDNAQTVQVWLCDHSSSGAFHDLYVHGYSGILVLMRPGMDSIGLSGLFILMLLCIYAFQGIAGFLIAYSSLVKQEQGNSASVIADLAISAEWASASSLAMLLRKVLEAGRAEAEKEVEQKSLEAAGAKAAGLRRDAEWKGTAAERQRRTLRRAAAAATGEAATEQKATAQKAAEDAEEQRKNVVWQNILRYVVIENAPSLVLTSSFFCLQLKHMTTMALLKNVLSCLLSAAGALSKAKDAFLLGANGRAAACVIAFLVFGTMVKMTLAFICPSHVFSFAAFRCVAE